MSSERDKARYPFTNEAADFVKNLGIEIDDLTTEPYWAILKRAEQRIRQALVKPDESLPQEEDPNIEVPSFATAIMLMAYSDNENFKRRYAVAESKNFSKKLKDEPPDKILRIAKETFGWKIRYLDENEGQGDLLIHFKDFLNNTRELHELKWKLTNRILGSGYVRLTSDEASRLIEEEIQRKILEKSKRPNVEPPSTLQKTIESIRELASSGNTYQAQAQTLGLEVADMPPCIKKLLDTLSSGGRLSHVGRFTLTSFLVNTGATEDEVVNFFKSASDYDERKTRYQVEHISGVRGGRTKYTPPKCDTLKTHGLCGGPGELCSKVRHPMTYYRRKRTITRRKGRA